MSAVKYSAKGWIIKHGTSAAPTDVVANCESIGIDDGEVGMLDVTTHDTGKAHIPSGVTETDEVELDLLLDPDDTVHEAIRANKAARTLSYLTLIAPNSGAAKWEYSGYWTKISKPKMGVESKLIQTCKFKANTAHTYTQ